MTHCSGSLAPDAGKGINKQQSPCLQQRKVRESLRDTGSMQGRYLFRGRRAVSINISSTGEEGRFEQRGQAGGL